MDGYELECKLSEGRFGTVFKARSVETGDKVALKRVRARRLMPGLDVDPWSKSAEREVEVLSKVNHQHVVRLLANAASPETGTFFMVYELLAWDLDTFLINVRPLQETQVKSILLMLLRGLSHLHSCNIMHRDIKPANLLFEAATGFLKLADFGSARFHPTQAAFDPTEMGLREASSTKHEELTREVCTRWYKCPEMLFGSIDYGLAVDLWATGCVMGDLLTRSGTCLFEGGSDIEQLCVIFQMRGTPQLDDWPEVELLPDFGKIEFVACEPQPFPFQAENAACSLEAVELAESLLQLNPSKRLLAKEALTHIYFDSLPLAAVPASLAAAMVVEPKKSDRHLQDCDDFVSDGSDFGSPDCEFESIPIETTSCGLWDGISGAPAEDILTASSTVRKDVERSNSELMASAQVRRSTPPPPQGGRHRFKPGVM